VTLPPFTSSGAFTVGAAAGAEFTTVAASAIIGSPPLVVPVRARPKLVSVESATRGLADSSANDCCDIRRHAPISANTTGDSPGVTGPPPAADGFKPTNDNIVDVHCNTTEDGATGATVDAETDCGAAISAVKAAGACIERATATAATALGLTGSPPEDALRGFDSSSSVSPLASLPAVTGRFGIFTTDGADDGFESGFVTGIRTGTEPRGSTLVSVSVSVSVSTAASANLSPADPAVVDEIAPPVACTFIPPVVPSDSSSAW
jgi:hypothetical protein